MQRLGLPAGIVRKLVVVLLSGAVMACAGAQVSDPSPAALDDTVDQEAVLRGLDELRAVDRAYYANIIRVIGRCFRPPPGSGAREAIVAFSIEADGSVAKIRLHESSGDSDFDAEALGAIGNCAGNERFGPLPKGLKYVPLPILFSFRPAGL